MSVQASVAVAGLLSVAVVPAVVASTLVSACRAVVALERPVVGLALLVAVARGMLDQQPVVVTSAGQTVDFDESSHSVAAAASLLDSAFVAATLPALGSVAFRGSRLVVVSFVVAAVAVVVGIAFQILTPS